MSLRPPRAPPSRLEIALAAGLRALDIGAGKRALEDGEQEDPSKRPHVSPEAFIRDVRRLRDESTPSEMRPALLRAVERHVLQPANRNCRNQLALKYNDTKWEERDPLLGCPSGDAKAKNNFEYEGWPHYPAQIELRTKGGCTLSVIGIGDVEDDITFGCGPAITIASVTPAGQQGKGYNTLLRAVVVLIGCMENKNIYAHTTNYLSAYTLLRHFSVEIECTRVDPDDYRQESQEYYEFDTPRDPKEAEDLSYSTTGVLVKHNDENLHRAVNLLINAAVRCAEAAP
tara:strand:+ start:1159 stop:2016 length:858 start_codon:yes stop_codon:yes gene_type:complete